MSRMRVFEVLEYIQDMIEMLFDKMLQRITKLRSIIYCLVSFKVLGKVLISKPTFDNKSSKIHHVLSHVLLKFSFQSGFSGSMCSI